MRVILAIRTVGRLGIVRGILGMTGVLLLFTMDVVVFPRMLIIRSHRLCSVISCFGMMTLPRRHECGWTVKMRQCRHRQLSRAHNAVDASGYGRTVRLDNSELELLDSRIDEFSVLSLGTGDTFMDMDALDGDALGARKRDVGILDGDEGWLCLLYSASSGSSWDTSIAVGLDCKGLGHCRGFAWDPGPVGGQCLHVCFDRFVS